MFREIVSIFAAVSLLILVCLAVFWAEYHAEIARGLPLIASGPYYTDLFAAKNLPFLLGEVAGNAVEPSDWARLVQRVVAAGLYAILLGTSATICRKLLSFGELRGALASLGRSERIFLVIGGAVIAGCFFAGQSVGYRGVFFLLAMPGLLAISRTSSRDLRNLGLGTCVVVVLLMWGRVLSPRAIPCSRTSRRTRDACRQFKDAVLALPGTRVVVDHQCYADCAGRFSLYFPCSALAVIAIPSRGGRCQVTRRAPSIPLPATRRRLRGSIQSFINLPEHCKV